MNKTYRMLFVEDDLASQEYFQTMAKSCDIILDVFSTCQEAKNHILETKYDAYILDACLQDGTGLELATWIREQKDQTGPIAIISSIYYDAETFLRLKEVIKVNYVLQKPIEPHQLKTLLENICQKDLKETHQQITSKMKELQQHYAKSIPHKICFLIKLISQLQEEPTKVNLKNLKNEVHKLGGNAGSYGYPQVSLLCKVLEKAISNRMDNMKTTQRDPDWIAFLDDFLRKLKYEFQIVNPLEEKFQRMSPQITNKRLSLYIVDNDRKFLEAIQREKENFELSVMTESDPHKAMQKLSDPDFKPRIVLIDKDFQSEGLSGYAIIENARKNHNLLTYYGILLNKWDIRSKLEVAKKNVDVIVQKPIAVDVLLCAVQEGLKSAEYHDFKVLVVDDDPAVCQFISHALGQLGVQVTTLSDCTLICEALEKDRPHILLLDILMPEINGLDILHTLRLDMRYHNLVIVIITVQTNLAIDTQSYAYEADEVLHKPLNQEVLQRLIINLARRHKLWEKGTFDLTAGLLNQEDLHKQIRDFLENSNDNELQYLALFEIEDFDGILLERGHIDADALLVIVGNHLRRHLGKNAKTASLKNGRFAIIFEHTNLSTVQEAIQTILLSAIKELSTSEIALPINFNCGITAIVKGLELEKILNQAEEALHVAKKQDLNLPVRTKVHAVATDQHLGIKPKEVVLIDPDKDLLELLTVALKTHGLAITSYSSGEDALKDLLERHSRDLPGLIITERLLPDIDGVDLFRTLKKRFKAPVPLIFLTTLAADKDVIDALNEGALDCFTKPFHLSILMQKVMHLMFEHV